MSTIGSQGWFDPASGLCCLSAAEGGARVVDLDGGTTLTLDGALAAAVLGRQLDAPLLRTLAGVDATWARVLGAAADAHALTGSSVLRRSRFGRLFIELTGRCNERCLHCYAGSGPEVSDALPADLVRAALVGAADLGFDAVQFTGGDPLLCPELAEHVAVARHLGLSVEIYTNGLALSPALLASLAPHGPSFAMSVYAAEPAVHDAITRVAGSLERTARALRRVLDAGLQARVGIVVMSENASQLEPTIAWLAELGLPRERVGWDRSRGVGRGAFYDGSAQPGDAARPEVGTHSGEAAHRRRGKACIASNGEVFPCIFQRWLPLGSLHGRSLGAILAEPTPPRLPEDDERHLGLSCLDCRGTALALAALGRRL